MQAIMNLLILFICININIIFTTRHPDRRWDSLKNWLDNYVFTGISQECNWYFTTDFTSNLTRGNTIVIKDPPAHILYPDSFYGFKSAAGPKFNYKRVECEFDVEAPVNHGLVVTIQQINFDKECSDFVQLTNQDGSLNKTICDKFEGLIPRSYPGSKYLAKLNLDKCNEDMGKWEALDTGGRIHVKISVTNKNFGNLRYLFITFTAIERNLSIHNNDNTQCFTLPRKYLCDGIKNWKTAGDENNCAFDRNEKAIFVVSWITFVFFGVLFLFDANYKHRNRNAIPVQTLTTSANLIDRPSVNLDNNYNDEEPPSYGELFPDESQQVPSTSPC